MKDTGVYKISCENGYVYFGRSNNIKLRLHGHLHNLKKGNHPCKKMQKDFNLFGESAFEFIIVQKTNTYKEACILEKILVEKNILSNFSYNTLGVKIINSPNKRSANGIEAMIRMSISVPDPRYDILVKESEKLGISMGELIRRAIDGYRKLEYCHE